MNDRSLFAAMYDRLLAPVERAGLADRRRRLLVDASGRVLEIGGGTGANLDHYAGIASLTVLEPSAPMRRRLTQKAAKTPFDVVIHGFGIEDAPFADGSFDTIVSTLTLCSVTRLDEGLSRIRRLLSPDGRLLFLEHVVVPGWRGRIQRAADPLWGRLAGGCHLDRDVPAILRANGMAVTDCERFKLPYSNVLVGPAVQGSAIVRRRPE